MNLFKYLNSFTISPVHGVTGTMLIDSDVLNSLKKILLKLGTHLMTPELIDVDSLEMYYYRALFRDYNFYDFGVIIIEILHDQLDKNGDVELISLILKLLLRMIRMSSMYGMRLINFNHPKKRFEDILRKLKDHQNNELKNLGILLESQSTQRKQPFEDKLKQENEQNTEVGEKSEQIISEILQYYKIQSLSSFNNVNLANQPGSCFFHNGIDQFWNEWKLGIQKENKPPTRIWQSFDFLVSLNENWRKIYLPHRGLRSIQQHLEEKKLEKVNGCDVIALEVKTGIASLSQNEMLTMIHYANTNKHYFVISKVNWKTRNFFARCWSCDWKENKLNIVDPREKKWMCREDFEEQKSRKR